MCGIVYSKSFAGKDVTKTILKRFEAQRSRGTTSFGFYLPESNRLTHNVKETRIKNLLKRSKGQNHEVLFHHRFSTSTADVPNACHPFSTKDFFKNNYVGVHNGVISNDDVLEKQHLELGINYVSRQTNGQFNDSEALIYDIARYLEGEVDELTARGSIAFIIIKRNKDGKNKTLFFGRNNGNPLKMKMTKHSLTLSSQGEDKDVEANQLYSYDYETGELKKRYLLIPYYKSSWDKSSGYSSYYNPAYSNGYTDWDKDGNYCRPSWDMEEDEEILARQEFEDYNGYGTWTDGNAKSIIGKGDFVPRTGTQTSVAREILEESNGDYTLAAINALVEAEEAEREESRINDAIYTVISGEAYDDLCDYWCQINAYKVMMTKIAESYEQGVLNQEAQQTIIDVEPETKTLALTA